MNSSTNLINYTASSEVNNNDMDNNINNNASIDVVDYIKTDVYLSSSSTDKNSNSKNLNTIRTASISNQQQSATPTTISTTTTNINNFIKNNNNVKDVEQKSNGKFIANHNESINKHTLSVVSTTQTQSTQTQSPALPPQPPASPQSYIKKSFSTIEKKLPIFYFRKKSDPTCNETEAIKERPKFIKSSSIARLLGNTYSTKKANSLMQKMTNQQNGCNGDGSDLLNKDHSKSRTGNGSITSSSSSSLSASSSIPKIERFQKCSFENQYDSQCSNTTSNSNTQQQLNRVSSSEECNSNNNFNHNNHKVNNSNMQISSSDGLSVRTIRSISRGLSKFLWKKSQSIEISPPDPEYKVSYLGNVLTGWAKGDNCFEKPLATLWRNYTQNNKPDVIMRIKVCPSGLKATTRQHGLTEYWSHRITHCNAPKNYPRIFCWIYRHEGRKLKHELRCHAVLCSKESIAIDISKTLRENLARALREFKRDKINRQNARLSLVNSVYENPSMPRRKILLSIGGNNYRPPLERSKSAPKLMSIEEAIGEDDENSNSENDDETRMNTKHNKHLNEKPSCCAIDPIYPSMTLGRRRCRRGHSIRRTGTNNRSFLRASTTIGTSSTIPTTTTTATTSTPTTPVPTISLKTAFIDSNHKRSVSFTEDLSSITRNTNQNHNEIQNQNTMNTNCNENDIQISNDPHPVTTDRSTNQQQQQHCEYDDDFDSLLMCNNYDTESPLSVELMSYFDKKFNVKIMGSLNDLNIYDNTDVIIDCDKISSNEHQSLPPMIMSNNQSGKCKLLTSLSLDNLDSYESDIELDDLQPHNHHHHHNDHDLFLDDDEVFFTQDKILKSLSMNNRNNDDKQMNKENIGSIGNFDNDLKSDLLNEILANVNHLENDNGNNNKIDNHNTNNSQINNLSPIPLSILPLDSDEGSISSGCETASTVTTNLEESQLNSMKHQNDEHIDSITQHQNSMNLMEDITNTVLIASTNLRGDPPTHSTHLNSDIKTTTLITNLKPSSYNKYKYFNRNTTSSTTTNDDEETKDDELILGEGIHNKDIANINLINSNLDNIKIETIVNTCDDTTTTINNTTSTNTTNTNNDSESELSDESGYVEYNRRKNNNNNSFKIEKIIC